MLIGRIDINDWGQRALDTMSEYNGSSTNKAR